MSKVTSMSWKNTKLNIVDTPGHADFGGEVERVMSIVDGVCLLVDATEGPMAQTKFVLMKALARGIKPLVVINKVDRESSRVEDVENEVFDLMVNLGATDEQLDYTTIYASGRDGWAQKSMDGPKENMIDLLDAVVDTCPAPQVMDRPDFSMVVTMIEGDTFVGRICTGRIASGSAKVGDSVVALDNAGNKVDSGRITKIMARKGGARMELSGATAGDIVQVAGLAKATVGYTICSPDVKEALPANEIDPPTLVMTFCPNDSPMAGQDKLSTKMTSQMIGQRLMAEAETNIGIKVKQSTERAEAYDVMGRGELQLGILVENMRREGFELGVCPPKVLYKKGEGGERLEPIEEVVVEVDDEFSGPVINKLSERKAIMTDMRPAAELGRTRVSFECPTRGLLGYRNVFFTDTKGSGIMTRAFKGYEDFKGDIDGIRKGVLVSMKTGTSTLYSLDKLQARGVLFINPGADVYPGMIVGEHSRDNDLEVNCVEAKQLTNIRSAGADSKAKLPPPIEYALEEMIPYMQPDEMVEVTPSVLRLRKQYLDSNERKKMTKTKTA